jgi:hypothetical protein
MISFPDFDRSISNFYIVEEELYPQHSSATLPLSRSFVHLFVCRLSSASIVQIEIPEGTSIPKTLLRLFDCDILWVIETSTHETSILRCGGAKNVLGALYILYVLYVLYVVRKYVRPSDVAREKWLSVLDGTHCPLLSTVPLFSKNGKTLRHSTLLDGTLYTVPAYHPQPVGTTWVVSIEICLKEREAFSQFTTNWSQFFFSHGNIK